MQIVLDTRGLLFSVRNKCFLIETENISRLIHPSKISSIVVTMPCRISSPALLLAAQSEIPVIFCNPAGFPEARVWSSRFINISSLRRKQYKFVSTKQATKWAYRIIKLKIDAQLSNLIFIADRKPSLNEEVDKAKGEINLQLAKITTAYMNEKPCTKINILFAEAFAASRYWTLIGQKLPPPFTFTNRVKRYAGDPFNICINYLYGVLRNQTETAVLSMGLDPALGIMHRDGYKMPSLVFDLMEPFRPITDRLLLNAVLSNSFSENIIETDKTTLKISKQGRKQLISIFNDALHSQIKYCNKVSSLKNHILNEAKLLSDEIKKT